MPSPMSKSRSTRPLESLAGGDRERIHEHFPRDVKRAPEFWVVDPQRADVPPQTVDQHRVREQCVGAVGRRELVGELLEKREDPLALGVVTVQRVGNRAGKEGCEQVVDALRIEEHGKLWEDIWGWDAQGYHGQGYGGAGGVWTGDVRRGKDREISAVGSEDDVMNRV